MDRELVLAILAALLCGGALAIVGWYPTRSPLTGSGRTLERRTWRRLWLPFVPAVLLFAALCGWALVEPADAEPVPACLLWAAAPFASVVVRAAWRAVRSLLSARQDHAVATVGLFRPRIIVSARVAEALDAPALVAAIEHERAHARHRDPLRLWLAQLGSDLLWPWPAAYTRFQCWSRALELARDEEVRLRGVAGADLAAAIVTCLRFHHNGRALGAATLGGDRSFAAERIARLLRPLQSTATPLKQGALWPLAVTAGVSLAVLLGRAYGECMVRSFLAVL